MTKYQIIESRAAAAGVALVTGCVGLVFVFSDPVEGWPLRIVIAGVFFFVAGAVIGFIHPIGWPIAMLTAWAGVLMGGLITLAAIIRNESGTPAQSGPPELPAGLIMLFGSLGLTLVGGFFGKSFSRENAPKLPD